jgi:hypothetical protein
VLETVTQDPATAPKYQALLEMIRRYPPPAINAINSTSMKSSGDIAISSHMGAISAAGKGIRSILIMRADGRVIRSAECATLNIKLPAGVYIVRVDGTNGTARMPMAVSK